MTANITELEAHPGVGLSILKRIAVPTELFAKDLVMTAVNWKAVGDEMWKNQERVNGDLFAFTYGAMVSTLFRENFGDVASINARLDRMGYGIGCRLVDDFVSKLPSGTPLPRACSDLRPAAEILAKAAFRVYLNIAQPLTVGEWSEDYTSFSLTFPQLNNGGNLQTSSSGSVFFDGLGSEWVQLPEAAIKGQLSYYQMLCGIIRGVLEMLQMQTQVSVVADPLLDRSASSLVLSVKLVRVLDDVPPPSD